MKARSVSPAVLLIAVVFATSTGVQAFHSGGTAECTGCHSMHDANPTSGRLLRQSDSSSVCLSCHMDANVAQPSSYRVATSDNRMPAGVAPLQRSPGGDFGWLKKNYAYSVGGASVQEDGSSHGHSIVAADFGFAADASRSTAPGGSFPSQELGCTSCHDPHGRYRRMADGSVASSGAPIIGSGSYASSPSPEAGKAVGAFRLLAGQGYTKGGVTFSGVPAAVAPDDYNRSESSSQTRVAYGHGRGNGQDTWARWCSTCHPQMMTHGHGADEELSTEHRNAYASYVKSGDLSGTFTTSYSSLVPFVENVDEYPALAAHARSDDGALGGPQSTDLVTCLSCHRAHASGWEYGMRWNNKSTFLTVNGAWPGTDTTPTDTAYARGRTSAETQAAYYDRPASRFATYQRTLCNKCHARD